jgi:hypothetical protein
MFYNVFRIFLLTLVPIGEGGITQGPNNVSWYGTPWNHTGIAIYEYLSKVTEN